jgi:hypothetical protein
MPRIEHDPAFPPRRGPWGGYRPGAGAPRGNLNALRHGRYSVRVRRLARRLEQDPEFRAVYDRAYRAALKTIEKTSRDQSYEEELS